MHTLKTIYRLLKEKAYIAYPTEWEQYGEKVRLYARTLEGAKMKAQRYFNIPDQINITVYEENIYQ